MVRVYQQLLHSMLKTTPCLQIQIWSVYQQREKTNFADKHGTTPAE